MRGKIYIGIILLFALFYHYGANICIAQSSSKDSIKQIDSQKKYNQFYDSLRIRAQQKKITRLLHNTLIHKQRPTVDKKVLAFDYFNRFAGKSIYKIEIRALEVFGPSLTDTTRKARSKLEKFANKIHTKTNLNIINKNLLFKEGERLNPEVLYENERILRQLSFIQDVRIILDTDPLNIDLVKVTILTKDVFSFGATASAGGEKADFEIYNRNIFGAGHEVSVTMSGNLRKEPYFGVESYYSINNIKGKFINVTAGFSNTYREGGYGLSLDKEFLTPSIKWAGGMTGIRLTRANQISNSDPVRLADTPLSLVLLDGWLGRSFQIRPNRFSNSQITFTGRVSHQYFYDRPVPDNGNNQYFANRTFYMAGLTWSQRRFMRDQLIYSYGISEDIPEGFKNEIVVGYDDNEFGDRCYTHIYFSNGNLLPKRPGYLNFSLAAGGYFNRMSFEQGLIQSNLSFISRLMESGSRRFRIFGRLNYLLGIRRFEVENLLLRNGGHIRGFRSSIPQGKQRLSLNLETVFFQQKEIYKFYIALFLFADVGIIGSNRRLIFNQNYYSGLGVGIRLHNESLVLKTIQLRLAFYPYGPENMGLIGFDLTEQTKKRFYNFQPRAPEQLRFQ